MKCEGVPLRTTERTFNLRYFRILGCFMKEKLLHFGSHLLVAMLSAVLTLAMVDHEVGLAPTKLDRLERLIEEKFIGEADMTQAGDAAADAMIGAIGDRWSYYIPAGEYERYQEQMANAYVGVGITIQRMEDGSGFQILEVTAGGPAEEAGVMVNDLLIEVAGENIRELDTEGVRDLVKGEEGTYVAMTVLRKGENIHFSIERRQVQTPVATYEMLEGNVGLVTIVNFDSRCAQESIDAIETLLNNGAKKLIFDVRYNPGGYADELVKLLDYLLPEGELFRTVRYDGVEEVDTSDPEALDIPMAVLVNGSSYSAAEFFAAALREYEAAVVVGEPTVGKGYFQTTYELGDGSAVSLSIGKYYTPKGVSLAEAGGLTPDIVIEIDEETASGIYYGTLPPEEDPQIQAAVKALK